MIVKTYTGRTGQPTAADLRKRNDQSAARSILYNLEHKELDQPRNKGKHMAEVHRNKETEEQAVPRGKNKGAVGVQGRYRINNTSLKAGTHYMDSREAPFATDADAVAYPAPSSFTLKPHSKEIGEKARHLLNPRTENFASGRIASAGGSHQGL